MSIYNVVDRLQNMKFPGMASDVDEKGMSAEEKAQKGAGHFSRHASRHVLPADTYHVYL